ncbi:ABC transporter permease [Antrihabitans cavernicola]|uniref:FtsX-like permease family protein n=1 Tax=Antrihabitans cavernicola TaxID=2495913 RepID=A0A5A7SDV0_9NOCA|nr:FtsX-like permease family protein [Spelaeibacter cavernicola]KAA0022773.1 FtsX-like permease family protein [Spelaeibacter cavernicola]
MGKVSLRNLAAHKVRLALTLLSVVLGTAFVAGSFVFTDTLQRTFDGIFEGTAQGVDVRVSPQDAQSSGVPLDDVAKVAAIDGVRAVAPSVGGQVVLLTPDGTAVQTGGAPSIGESYLPPDKAVAKPDEFVAGTPPTKAGEIALNSGGAEKAHLAVGDKTKVLVPARGLSDVTVTGIYDVASDTGGFIGVLFDDAQARQLFTDGQHAAYIDVAGNGVSQNVLRDRIKAAFPDLKVQNGDEVRAESKADIEKALSFINYFLLAFGAIALLVGTFIIYNTFSMIVAQRLRELALLRAVGASRQQVGRSVVLEALIVGLVGSALGLATGVALAYGLRSLLNVFDLGLPSGSLQVAPRTIVVGLLVGVVVTVISAYAPARRAAKIPPVEAMREEFASTGDSLRMRTIVGVVFGIVGVIAVVVGAQSTGGGAASTVGVGALALIFAVLLAAPALSRPIVGGLGAVIARPFGSVGKLARSNAVRNPRRTAATAFALTLGLMLVSAIGIFGSSAKASVDTLVDQGVKADYVLTGPQAIGVPIGAGAAARSVAGVQDSVALHPVLVKIGDDDATGAAVDGALNQAFAYDITSGSDQVTGNNMLVSETQSSEKNWKLGDTVTMTTYDGKQVPTTVSGIYKDNQILGKWVVSEQVYQQVTPAALMTDFVVLVKAKPGADIAAMRGDLEKATKQFVIVQVQDREQFKGTQGKQIDTLLGVLYGLLALAIVIAILGIINTLALSVVERRREIGMLRAVGMQRAQVRRTIYLESVLIAVFGAIVGVLLGLTLGSGFIRTLRDQGLGQISVPWTQVIAMLIGSAVVGVLAALWPAVRAARTRPLEAIADV